MTILLTGFESFGTVTENPSQRIVEQFAAEGDKRIMCEVLPVVYAKAGTRIQTLLTESQPEAVMMLGVAQGRIAITPERFALNWNDAPLPDNAGNLVQGSKIAPDGVLAYMTTLPVDDFYNALQSADIPTAISNHAGAYVCNHVFYVALHTLAESGRIIPCGFVHVPGLKTDDHPDGLSIEAMVRGIAMCLDVLSAYIGVANEVL